MERRVTTVRQLELLCEFMGGHRDLALGRVRSKEGRVTSQRLYLELTSILNPEGPGRTWKEWAKVWNDLKSKVKLKLIAIKKGNTGTGGGPYNPITLTSIEESVAGIIGRDSGFIEGVTIEGQVQENMENPADVPSLVLHDSCPDSALEITVEDHDYIVPVPPQSSSAASSTQPPPPTPPRTPATNTTPPSIPHLRDRRNVRPRTSRTQEHPDNRPENRGTALSDVHTMMSIIELLRAETSRELAAAAARQAEAAMVQANALTAISGAIVSGARSIERLIDMHLGRLTLQHDDA